MSDKIFCGSGKTIKTQYGELIKLSFGPRDLEAMMANKNEKGWVNVVVAKRREVGQYGETHSCSIDMWKPDGNAPSSNTQVDPNAGPGTW